MTATYTCEDVDQRNVLLAELLLGPQLTLQLGKLGNTSALCEGMLDSGGARLRGATYVVPRALVSQRVQHTQAKRVNGNHLCSQTLRPPANRRPPTASTPGHTEGLSSNSTSCW